MSAPSSVPPHATFDDPRSAREMEAVGVLSHSNIVRAVYAGEHNGIPYPVVEYGDGLNLSEISKRLGVLPIADACELVRQAAVGLQHAHEHGLVHRDIKPSNLMLTIESGRHTPCAVGSAADGTRRVPATLGLVKILDLTLALLQSRPSQPQGAEMTAAGPAMGAADYIAPERVTDSHHVDIPADIYSLGCTVYKLLCGRTPFVGPEYRNEVAKMMAHVRQEPPPIAALRSDMPVELAAVVQRTMARDPAQRFGTPAEVAAALASLAAGCDLAGVMAKAIQRAEPVVADPTRSVSTGQLSASPVSDTAPHLQPEIAAD